MRLSPIAARITAAIILVLLSGISLSAEEKAPEKNLVLPGETFLVQGRTAFIFWPEESKRKSPQPWVMYAPTLPSYPDVHEQWMHQQLVDAGVAVAGIDVGEAYGSPECQAAMDDLYEELTTKRGFAPKLSLLGRSRGGLWVSSWAVKNVDKVAGLAGIYPVFDLRTYPGLKRAAPAYGMQEAELLASLPEYNPIAKTSALAEAGIPICIIHGDDDRVVPFKENSATLHEQYARDGVENRFELIVPRGQGHNFWPGFFHCQNLVDFSILHANRGAGIRVKRTEPSRVATYRDLVYQPEVSPALKLDLYRPNDSTTCPVVVWVHGGGWKNGSKDRCPAAWLTAHGIAVASIEYRLIDRAQWPSQLDDCRAAVRWLRKNAGEFGLDPAHIGAWGSSAGGHLVALMGTAPVPENEPVSSRVQAVCDWFGPSDLLTMPPNVVGNGRTEQDVADSNGAKLLGATVKDVPELAQSASALYQVSDDDAPFLIMHGDADPGVPLDQSQRLHEALVKAGIDSTIRIIPGAGHGGKEFQTEEVQEQIRQFFTRHLFQTQSQH
ncbi:MAG: prolyl oligopeptidase family serine peptidase [Planctomycetaceae bacterium]|nr:prolyl oligopeptidase family serine peptidase [Planctomycetaceae bacterium]